MVMTNRFKLGMSIVNMFIVEVAIIMMIMIDSGIYRLGVYLDL